MFEMKDYQAMKAMFSQLISRYSHTEGYFNKRWKELYDRCDPEDDSTQSTFILMNSYRDSEREWRKKRERVEALQKKVKKELEHCVETDRWLTQLEAEGGAFHKDLEE